MVNNVDYLSMLGNSDHACIQLNMVCYTVLKNTSKPKYNVNATNFDLMESILNGIAWENVLMPLEITHDWSIFKPTFQDAIDQCIPIFKPQKKKSLYMSVWCSF